MRSATRCSMLGLLTVLALTACAAGSGSPGSSKTPDSSENTAAPAPTVSTSPGSVDDEARDDLTGEHVVSWISADPVGADGLRVSFIGGDTSCVGYRAIVRPEADQVRIAVIEGALPGAPEACSAVGRSASLLVRLDQPLGKRTAVPLTIDGAIPPP